MIRGFSQWCIILPLHSRAYTITFIVLSGVTAGCWILYFYEAFFRSGKIRSTALKKQLSDLFLILLIASVTCLIMFLVSQMGAHPFK